MPAYVNLIAVPCLHAALQHPLRWMARNPVVPRLLGVLASLKAGSDDVIDLKRSAKQDSQLEIRSVPAFPGP